MHQGVTFWTYLVGLALSAIIVVPLLLTLRSDRHSDRDREP